MPADTSIPDPNVKIPDAIKALAARSEEIYHSAYTPPTEEAQQNSEEANAAESRNEPVPAEQQASSLQDAPAASETPPPPTPEAKPEEQSWEHKYKSMKGRFDRLSDQFRQQSEQIAALQATLASMRSPAKSEEDKPAPKRLITPEEEQDYGPELLQVVGKKAREEFHPEVEALRRELENLKQSVQGVSGTITVSARNKLLETMDREIPNWHELNQDERFLSWLALPEAYTGTIRQELLEKAFERNDFPRVKAFFDGFLAEEAVVDPAAARGPDDRNLVAKPATSPKIPLESLAAPGRAKTAAASAPVEKPVITRADIAAFYTDVRSGKYNGKDEEKNRLEQQIIEATREGRIR